MYPKLEFRICKDGNIRVFCALEAFGSGLGGGGAKWSDGVQLAMLQGLFQAFFLGSLPSREILSTKFKAVARRGGYSLESPEYNWTRARRLARLWSHGWVYWSCDKSPVT